ncbi:MAG: amidohydrolase family protein [Deltaproteobacteria bacterium]|nr:MAG: amidohydrolase family protein [Deltaproteobacteria bacterium]
MDRIADRQVIDSHIHCGIQNVNLPYEVILPLLQEADITGACLFPPVEDIYDRYNPNFQDNEAWRRTRRAANHYLLDLAAHDTSIFPYLFVWNDFALEELEQSYLGIKWHRHDNEPVYHYDDPRCAMMIQEISARRLPVVLEESFANTCRFVERLAPEAVIIIPHLGALNGSYPELERAGIWQRSNTYADSALASPAHMHHFIKTYGADRLLFGSDFPFGTPGHELRKVERLGLSSADLDKVVSGNLQRLLNQIKRV